MKHCSHSDSWLWDKEIPKDILEDSATSIGDWAFYNRDSLTSITATRRSPSQRRLIPAGRSPLLRKSAIDALVDRVV